MISCLVAGWCSPAFAEWHVSRVVDLMIDRAVVASVMARGATLRLACNATGPALVFDAPVAARNVGLSYRFDSGPIVQRIAVVGSDFRTVYPWLASPGSGLAAVARSRRLRVQIFPTGSAPAFYDFDLAGAGDAVRALGCR